MVRHVDAHEVHRLLQEQRPLVIDALPRDSYDLHHLPEAINIPAERDDLDDIIARRLPDDKDIPIITYCLDEDCKLSPFLAHVLEEHHGYRNVHEFDGGLRAWRRAGYNFIRPEKVGRT